MRLSAKQLNVSDLLNRTVFYIRWSNKDKESQI